MLMRICCGWGLPLGKLRLQQGGSMVSVSACAPLGSPAFPSAARNRKHARANNSCIPAQPSWSAATRLTAVPGRWF